MNIENGLSRNTLSCYGIKEHSRTRQFGSPASMGWNDPPRSSRRGGTPYCSPSRSSRLESTSREDRQEMLPTGESKRKSITKYMREVLCGMGGKRDEVDAYDVGTLYVLMALRESGKEELVRQVLTAADAGLEWKISIRGRNEVIRG